MAVALIGALAAVSLAAAQTGESAGSIDVRVEHHDSQAAPKPVMSVSEANSMSHDPPSSLVVRIAPHLNDTAQIRDVRSQSEAAAGTGTASAMSISVEPEQVTPPELYVKFTHASHSTKRYLGVDSELRPVPIVDTVHASHSTKRYLGVDSELRPVPIVDTVHASHSTRNILSYEPVILEQNRIPDNTLEIVYDHTLEHNELVINSDRTLLRKIIVTEQTDEPRLNLENLLLDAGEAGGNSTATFPNDLEMDVVFEGISADLLLRNDTEITGPPDWDGVVNLPTFTEVHVPVVSGPDGGTGNVRSTLHMGLYDDMLTFDKPIRVTFEEKAGQNVLFHRGGGDDEPVSIDETCSHNDHESVSVQLNGTGECKIDVDADLTVWTFHFTDFITVGPPPRDLVPPDTPVDPSGPPGPPSIPPIPIDPHETLPPTPELPRDRQTSRSSSGGGGGGGGGGHPASGSLDDIYVDLYSVSWDCNAGTVRIIAGPDEPELVSAQVRTTAYGMQQAAISDEMLEGRIVFTSGIAADESYLGVQVHAMSGRSILSASEGITVQECVGEETFSTYREPAGLIPQDDGILQVPSNSGARDADPVMPPAFVPEPVEPVPVEPTVPVEPIKPMISAEPAGSPEPTMPAEPAVPKPTRQAEDRGLFEMFMDFVWKLFGW